MSNRLDISVIYAQFALIRAYYSHNDDNSSVNMIEYALETNLDSQSFIDVLEASGLGDRRPIHDRSRIQRMLSEASLILTARAQGKLIGVARALTDHSFCVYLSDLAVDRGWQGQGIGRELIHRTHVEAGRNITDLILLAAPEAETYYPHIGLRQFPQCFIRKRNS